MKWSKEKSVCVQSLVGAALGFDNLLLQKIFLQENLSIRLTFFSTVIDKRAYIISEMKLVMLYHQRVVGIYISYLGIYISYL